MFTLNTKSDNMCEVYTIDNPHHQEKLKDNEMEAEERTAKKR